jgi:biliverdin reductase
MTDIPLKSSLSRPLRVGLVGTGYAAKLRAETLQTHLQASLVAVAGHTLEKTQEFCQTHGGEAVDSWARLIQDFSLDVLIICTINRDHGTIARAALQAGIHVVVEYPLSLDVSEAEALIVLAKSQDKLLHVEHIELMGGVHQALKASLPQIGRAFYARYVTTKPERPAPQRWTYHSDLFGFPLIGALSRLHRLIDLFGKVATVSCQARYWQPEKSNPYYIACLCTAQLRFQNGLIAEVTYSKGETFWQAERRFEVQGEQGAVIIDGDQGMLVRADGNQPIEIGGRRGLFARDTEMVIANLLKGDPLYVTPEESLYTLKVADAARRSADTGQTVEIP